MLSVSVQGLSADASALLLGPDGKVRGDHDLVFYNHPAQDGVSVEGAAVHCGAFSPAGRRAPCRRGRER
ncbi:TerD family protein (plasmid) [Streptomyces sp. GDS52]|uniref:TerD family protein n=1 Tax=Streptomyces sp. GDS52 TaxID=3406419 RepID=UPI003FD2490A